jgi:hypothetical protein
MVFALARQTRYVVRLDARCVPPKVADGGLLGRKRLRCRRVTGVCVSLGKRDDWAGTAAGGSSDQQIPGSMQTGESGGVSAAHNVEAGSVRPT